MPAPFKSRWSRRAIGLTALGVVAGGVVAVTTQAQASTDGPTPSSVAALTGPGAYTSLLAGAKVPFTEYEAENAKTNGSVLGPDRSYTTIAAEASGRKAVKLSAQGGYVQFTLARAANAVDFRYAVPDSADGAGLTAGLSLYVDGQKSQTLSLTSRYSDVYGNYPFTNNPAEGGGHHYFDDVRTMFGRTLPAGTRVKLQVDAGDSAPWYVIDTADFEQVAAPKAQPAGSLSVIDFGADPTGAADSTSAVQAAVNAGQAQSKAVWIPSGTFTVTGQLTVDQVTLTGAGPWYSVLHGAGIGIFGHGAPNPSSAVHLADFAIIGETVVRNDQIADSGLGGSMGGGSTVDNLWIEHTKVGAWFDGPSDGLTLTHLRIQNTMADGINLHNGVSHTTVSDSFIRNTGDDGLAMWSDQNANHDNTFTRDTVIAPVLANAFAIYGGHDNSITSDIGADTVTQGGGAHVGNRFGSVPLAGTTAIQGNLFARTGDVIPGFPTTDSAIWLWAADSPMTGTVNITHNVALDSSYAGLQFVGSSITNVHVDDLLVAGAGTFAVQLQSAGSATISHLVATGLGTAGVYDCASGFTIAKGAGNVGWNSTKCGFPPIGQLNITPTTGLIAFGDQALNATATKTITIASPGPKPITITSVTAPNGYTLGNHCTTIPAGGSCTIDVNFTPTASAFYTGFVTIDSTSPAGPYLMQLTGLGFDPNGNLALGHPITASSDVNDYYGPQKANDGDQSSYFESLSNAFPQTLTVDLTAVRSIDRVVLQLPTNWGGRTETVEIQGSTDGTTFTQLVAPAGYFLDPNTGNSVTITFPATDARYVRLVGTGNTDWPAMQFSEFQVWAH